MAVWICILLACILAATSVTVFLYFRFGEKKKANGTSGIFPEDFIKVAEKAYEAHGSILGMLEELLKHYADGKIHKKLEAARNYLLSSRYKDYETTLYCYLDTDSEEIKELYARIILKEISKRMRITMKN